jgi:NAD(P)-dependent dehydrogenase (short-subunit alcohol dehydrogenase family)
MHRRASSGIGRAAAIALTTKGFTVYAGVRKESDAESIRAEGIASLHPLMLDVTSTESIAHAAEEIAKTGQPLVALVNNAGITSNLPLEIVPMATFKRNYDVNVFGLLETTQHFAAMLRESKGRIVNIGSAGGSVIFPGMAPYMSSKHAIEGLTDGMRQEMLDHGVSVSLVRPGVIKTDIYGKMLSNTKASGVADEVTAQLTAGRGSNVTKELYRKTVEAVVAVAKMTPYDPMASGVEITDAAILHAVTSPFPKCRYHVGPDAIMLTALNDYLLPDRVFDW